MINLMFMQYNKTPIHQHNYTDCHNNHKHHILGNFHRAIFSQISRFLLSHEIPPTERGHMSLQKFILQKFVSQKISTAKFSLYTVLPSSCCHLSCLSADIIMGSSLIVSKKREAFSSLLDE